MKRAWGILWALLLLAAPSAVQAQFTYTTNADGVSLTITGYTGPPWAVTIPSNINGLTVTNIGNYAFEGKTSLTSVTIPGSVTNIAFEAFCGCSNLTSVYFGGRAPTADLTAFAKYAAVGYDPVTVYYLPGTTGWSNTFKGIPTIVWLPKIQSGSAGFGVENSQFGFDMNWDCGQTVGVDACTNLTDPVWVPVSTNALASGSCGFSDPQWTNYPGRSYRLRSP